MPERQVTRGGGHSRRRLIAGGALIPLGVLAGACATGGSTAGGPEGSPQAGALKGAIRFSHLGQNPHPDVFARLAGQFQQAESGGHGHRRAHLELGQRQVHRRGRRG